MSFPYRTSLFRDQVLPHGLLDDGGSFVRFDLGPSGFPHLKHLNVELERLFQVFHSNTRVGEFRIHLNHRTAIELLFT